MVILSFSFLLILLLLSTPDSSSPFSQSNPPTPDSSSIRLNRSLTSVYSRREADELIRTNQVRVNGKLPTGMGDRVTPGVDVVTINNERVDYEKYFGHNERNQVDNEHYVYVKYNKPSGITCTTDRRIEGNIMDELEKTLKLPRGYRRGTKVPADIKHNELRLFPIGRLDKDTTGLILISNDGDLPNASLRSSKVIKKTYHVQLDRRLSSDEMNRLRNGVIITTFSQRDRQRRKKLTAETLPCEVDRLPHVSSRTIRIVLTEGRNRQIRRMCKVLGAEVVKLERVEFAGIQLGNLSPGAHSFLSKQETKAVKALLKSAGIS